MNKKKLVLFVLLTIFVLEIVCAVFWVKPDMSHIGEAPHKIHEIFGIEIPFHGINISTIVVSWIVMSILVFSSFWMTCHLKEIPGRSQALFEMIIEAFEQLCIDTLGEKGRLFMPYVTTLFLFVLMCNWIGMIPIPGLEEPTKDLNTKMVRSTNKTSFFLFMDYVKLFYCICYR